MGNTPKKFSHFRVDVELALCRDDTDWEWKNKLLCRRDDDANSDRKKFRRRNLRNPSHLESHLNSFCPVIFHRPWKASSNGRFYHTTVDFYLKEPLDASELREELDLFIAHRLWAGDIAYVITKFYVVQQDYEQLTKSRGKK